MTRIRITAPVVEIDGVHQREIETVVVDDSEPGALVLQLAPSLVVVVSERALREAVAAIDEARRKR